MILISKQITDDIEGFIQQKQQDGYELFEMNNNEKVVIMKFLEPDELRPPTIEEIDNDLKNTKNELSSTQMALSDVYEQLILLQEQLDLMQGGTNNG